MSVILLSPAPSPDVKALETALRVGLGDVRTTDSVEATAAAWREQPRAVVVADLRRPGQDGGEPVSRLRRELPAARLLVLTVADSAPPAEADAVLSAPVYLSQVVGWCARALSAPLGDGALADLATGLSHEIGNPLTSMLLQLEMLKQQDGMDDILGQLELIEDSSRRIQNVVRDVAGASERRPVAPETVAITDLVDEARALLAQQEPALAGRLEVHGQDERVSVERSLVVRALADLWRYLLLAGDEGDVLLIEVGVRDPETLAIQCRAQVPRLPPDAAARLFTPLWARQALGLSDDLSLTSARSAFLRHRGDLQAREQPGGALRVDALLPRFTNGQPA